MNATCENCQFWRQGHRYGISVQTHYGDIPRPTGTCHRRAPAVSNGQFPVVWCNDFCGEFAQRNNSSTATLEETITSIIENVHPDNYKYRYKLRFIFGEHPDSHAGSSYGPDRWCPFTRVQTDESVAASNRVAYPRRNEDEDWESLPTQGSFCLGCDCAMWRKAENNEPYCGLAGPPHSPLLEKYE